MALPTNDKIIGDLGHTEDHNAIVDEIVFIKDNYVSASSTALTDNYLRKDTASALYATISSPEFIGTPLAPTAASGTNTTQIATTEFVKKEISNLIDGAPELLDTLSELAAALGDDANFAAATASAIASMLTISSASETYLTITDASNTYLLLSSSSNFDLNGSASTAQAAAQSYADSLATNYDAAGSASSAQTAAQSYADSLAVNYDPVGSASAARAAAESYADSLAPNYDVAGSASAAQTAAQSYSDSLSVNYDAVGSASAAQAAANAYTSSAIASLVGSAPETLDTLNELATALGDDPNFSTTVTNSLSTKLDSGTASTIYLTQSDASDLYFPKSASGALLTETEASNLYLPISASSTLAPIGYLSSSAAAEIYLRQDTASSIYATIISPVFSGEPSAPTVSVDDISNRIATTEFVANAVLAIQTGSASLDLSVYLRQDTASATYLAKNDTIDGGAP
jgi:hypothetical protein